MYPNPRQRFNASFSEEMYQRMIHHIHEEYPGALDFRVSESPVFIGKQLKAKVLKACSDITDRLVDPDFRSLTDRAIPPQYVFDTGKYHPECLVVDFAICADGQGDYVPQLIELQGFPSLYAYQSYLAGLYRSYFDVDDAYSSYFDDLDGEGLRIVMREFLKMNDPSRCTVLLEAYPDEQKTRIDFVITEREWGIPVVCLSELIIDNHKLYYKDNSGVMHCITDVYNRVIFDDVERNYPHLQSKVQELRSVEVNWICHPHWYYRASKYCMPLIDSPYVPDTHYLHEVDLSSMDLTQYVLKPLFSFSGSGVEIDVTRAMVDRIQDPENYILQRKVSYEPLIKDVRGDLVKFELRMLHIWPEYSNEPRLLTNLVRMSRGKMIGVNFNKDFDWVGGSVAFFEK